MNASDDMLASLLATATGALHSDRRMAQRCIERAAVLLGIDLQHSYPQGGLASWQVKRLRSYINDRLDSAIRARDLAGVVRLSTSHFFRVFRRTFGESPYGYITKRRMERAQELMVTSQASLAQVALECGMCDQAHFSRTFRRIVGTNPATWRRRFGGAPRYLTQSGLSHAARAARKSFSLKGRNLLFEYTAKTGICGDDHSGNNRVSAPLATASSQ
jgi:AraC family transcriptional regulator